MSIYKLAGKLISRDTAFRHADIQYPANWIALATPEELDAIGITIVEEQPRPDDSFYWVTANEDGSFSAIPKDLAQKRSELVESAKTIAGAILAKTDWKVVRAVETGTQMDNETSKYRASVRSASDAHEANIAACRSIDELALLRINWPVAPWEIKRIVQ